MTRYQHGQQALSAPWATPPPYEDLQRKNFPLHPSFTRPLVYPPTPAVAGWSGGTMVPNSAMSVVPQTALPFQQPYMLRADVEAMLREERAIVGQLVTQYVTGEMSGLSSAIAAQLGDMKREAASKDAQLAQQLMQNSALVERMAAAEQRCTRQQEELQACKARLGALEASTLCSGDADDGLESLLRASPHARRQAPAWPATSNPACPPPSRELAELQATLEREHKRTQTSLKLEGIVVYNKEMTDLKELAQQALIRKGAPADTVVASAAWARPQGGASANPSRMLVRMQHPLMADAARELWRVLKRPAERILDELGPTELAIHRELLGSRDQWQALYARGSAHIYRGTIKVNGQPQHVAQLPGKAIAAGLLAMRTGAQARPQQQQRQQSEGRPAAQ